MSATVKYYQSVTYLGGAELQNPRIHNLDTTHQPTTAFIGQMYYNTDDSCLYVCYQVTPTVAWKKVGAGGAVVQADSSVTNPAINVASSSDSTGLTTYKLSVQGLANSNISTNAAIAWSKLATGTASRLAVTNGSGVLTTSPFSVAAGGTGVAGNINVAGYRVTNVADPIDGTDAINFTTLKAWFSGNVDIHEPCDVATTANIALTGDSVPTTFDGIDLTVGGGSTTRVLVWNQTDPVQNGIYTWNYNSSTGKATMVRADDCNENTELYPGSTTYVINGNTYGATGFVQKDQGSGVGGAIGIGSEANEWVENYSITRINAGAGLTRTGNTIAVNPNSTLMIDTNSKVGLATVTVTTSGAGASNKTPTITVDSYGRVTGVEYKSIEIAASGITSGYFTVTQGGIGTDTLTANEILVGNGTNKIKSISLSGVANNSLLSYTGTGYTWISPSSLTGDYLPLSGGVMGLYTNGDGMGPVSADILETHGLYQGIGFGTYAIEYSGTTIVLLTKIAPTSFDASHATFLQLRVHVTDTQMGGKSSTVYIGLYLNPNTATPAGINTAYSSWSVVGALGITSVGFCTQTTVKHNAQNYGYAFRIVMPSSSSYRFSVEVLSDNIAQRDANFVKYLKGTETGYQSYPNGILYGWQTAGSITGTITELQRSDASYLPLSGGTVTGLTTFTNGITISGGNVTISGLGSGVVHINSSGVLSVSNVSLTSEVTGILPLANGGTNKNLSGATNYGVVYKASDGLAVTGSGTANYPLVGAGTSTAPKWASYALPASLTANTIMTAISTTAVGCTNVLPFTVGIEQGGTNATTVQGARTNLQVPRYFSQPITNWTTQDYTVTHSYGTSKAIVQLYEVTGTGNSATYDKIDVGLTVTTSTIILSSAQAGIMSGKNLLLTAVFFES